MIALVGGLFLGLLRARIAVASGSVDIQNFHLPGVISWIQSGSIWHNDEFLPDVALGNFPNNGDVILLATVLPWKDDFLSHLAMYPFYLLTGIAVYALALEVGVSRPLAAIAGCLLLAVPAVAGPALIDGIVDAVMLFGFAAGALFLLRHFRTAATSDLVLGGVALGISFGTKWYGVSCVVVVLVVWALASLLARRDPRSVALQGAALAGLVLLAGGIWLLRNWVVTGNPFFPVRIAPLGVTIFGAPFDLVRRLGGFTIAHYLDQPSVWGDHILPQLRQGLAAPSVLIAVGVVLAAGVLAARRRLRFPGGAVLAAGVGCAVLLAIAYAVTPYSAGGPAGNPVLVGPNARYLVPALVIGVVVAVAAVGAVRWAAAPFALLALAAVVDGIRWSLRGTLIGTYLGAAGWLVGIALVLFLGWGMLWLWPRLPRDRHLAMGTAATVGLVIVAVAGYAVQRHYGEHRYMGDDPTIDWIDRHAATGERIGLAGLWTDRGISPVLPAFGPRFGNSVSYLGRFEEGMLRAYPNRREFISALRSGGYDYLIVGRGRPESPTVEAGSWARAAGFLPVTASDRLALYRAPS
jgi:hypothetical protein